VHFRLRTLALVAALPASCSTSSSGTASSTSTSTASGIAASTPTTSATPPGFDDERVYDLKRPQLVEFGYTDRNPAEFEEDHLVPLELAGAPQDPKNLWPQPWADARVKDQEENDLHIAVCQHRMALGDAQAKILADWGPG
jgi:hypothetical protein